MTEKIQAIQRPKEIIRERLSPVVWKELETVIDTLVEIIDSTPHPAMREKGRITRPREKGLTRVEFSVGSTYKLTLDLNDEPDPDTGVMTILNFRKRTSAIASRRDLYHVGFDNDGEPIQATIVDGLDGIPCLVRFLREGVSFVRVEDIPNKFYGIEGWKQRLEVSTDVLAEPTRTVTQALNYIQADLAKHVG